MNELSANLAGSEEYGACSDEFEGLRFLANHWKRWDAKFQSYGVMIPCRGSSKLAELPDSLRPKIAKKGSNIMKKVSKIISMIMACALVMGLALTPALAAMELDDTCFSTQTINEVETRVLNAGEYELTKDYSTGAFTVNNNASINLGGNKLITSGTITVDSGATLTVTSTDGDGNATTAKGTIKSTVLSTNANAPVAAIQVTNGSFEAEHVNIKAEEQNARAVQSDAENAEGVIKLTDVDIVADDNAIDLGGGSLDAEGVTAASKNKNRYALIATQSAQKVSVTGGELKSQGSSHAVSLKDGVEGTFEGCTITGGKRAMNVLGGATATLTNVKAIGGTKNGCYGAIYVQEANLILDGTTQLTNSSGYELIRMLRTIDSQVDPSLTVGPKTNVKASDISYVESVNNISDNVENVGGTYYDSEQKKMVTVKNGRVVGTVKFIQVESSEDLPDAVKNATLNKDGGYDPIHADGGTYTAVEKSRTTDTMGAVTITYTWSFEAGPEPVTFVMQPANTEIDDEDVPLAGMVAVKELVGYLYEREGYELPAAAEDSTELYDYAPAMEWAVENAIVDKDVDPDEIVTVGIAENILNAYAAVFASKPDLGFEIDGEDDDIIDDIADVLKDFLAQLKG